ncbi:MAG: NUDIX domain-containing protein [Gemmataceae bacterium]
MPDAAARELVEETSLRDVFLDQVAAIGTPGRDLRGHTITVLWVALAPGDRGPLAASGDAAAVQWFDVASLPPLAFDHAALLELALGHLRRRIDETPVCFELLPQTFTLSELQAVSEAILGRSLDRRNFRRQVLDLGLVEPTAGTRLLGGSPTCPAVPLRARRIRALSPPRQAAAVLSRVGAGTAPPGSRCECQDGGWCHGHASWPCDAETRPPTRPASGTPHAHASVSMAPKRPVWDACWVPWPRFVAM